MNHQTTQDLEEYAQQVLKIPYVNFHEIDFHICKALLNTLEEVFHKYPLLKDSLCAIGSQEDIEAHINLISSCEEGYEGWTTFQVPKSYYFSCICGEIDNSVLYCGMILGNGLQDCTLKEINELILYNAFSRMHTIHTKSMRELVWHEVGHIMDFVLHISSRPEFQDLLETFDIEQTISRYATKNELEALAEAFAEYHATTKPNKAVYQITRYVLKEYKKREAKKSEIFNISKAYKLRTRTF